MVELRDCINESVHLAVRDGTDAVIVDRVESTQVLRVAARSAPRPLCTRTSAGRAMKSLMPENEVRVPLGGEHRTLTAETVVNVAELVGLVQQARRLGYATNIRQNDEGVCAVAAAVIDTQQQPIAAIIISAPASRFSEDKGMASLPVRGRYESRPPSRPPAAWASTPPCQPPVWPTTESRSSSARSDAASGASRQRPSCKTDHGRNREWRPSRRAGFVPQPMGAVP